MRVAANGVRFGVLGEIGVSAPELERIVAAVPNVLAPALADRAFYFVPLALPERAHSTGEGTVIAPVFTAEFADEAVCHRNVSLPAEGETPAHEGVFISARLLQDRFALAFELFINVGHAFATGTGVPESFGQLCWTQAMADVRGETSQDAHEARAEALADRSRIDEKARTEYFEAAFADALAIYQLSLAVDFDYSELREREYPLLAPAALAERLRLVARLFPANDGYDFQIKYRRRA